MSDYGGAIASNPRVALVDLTQQGSDWLWAVFAVMVVSGLGMTVWAHSLPPGRRAFHYMAAMLLFTASVAYFAMASDLGATPINVEFVRNTAVTYTGDQRPVNRSIWYARYIDWTITTPLLLLTLLLGTGMPLGGIIFTIFIDLVMIVTGLIGALVASTYKWGFWTFGTVAMLYIFWVLVVPARRQASALSPEAGKAYTTSAFVLAGLWFVYPIIWGVADGGNVISTDSEMVAYGVLDLLAKPVFTYFHMYQLSKVPYESFLLQSGHYSIGATNDSSRLEKQALNGHHQNGAVDGGHSYPPNAPVSSSAAPTSTNASTTGHTGHPSVVQDFQNHGSQHATSGQGVVQHTTA